MSPLILYGFVRSPPTRAVLVVAKAIDVKIELKHVDFLKAENKSEEYLKKNPAHTVPTLEDNGVYIWESRAIMGYLIQKYGKNDKLYPREAAQRALVDTILYFDNGSLYKTFLDYIGPQLFTDDPPNEQKLEQAKDNLATLERILAARPYVAGDHLTIADISVVTSLWPPTAFGFSYDSYPKVVAYIDKIRKEIPFYEDLVKTGEDEFAAFVHGKLRRK